MTIGWIFENASDRYWESAGFLDYVPFTTKRFNCPYCSLSYYNESDLLKHKSVEHPIKRPVLFLNYKEAVSEQTIRYGLDPGGIVLDATVLKVSKNGEESTEWTRDQLKQHLCNDDDAHYVITLINIDEKRNSSVDASYTVQVKIPQQSELDEIDEKFIKTLAIEEPTMEDVREFTDSFKVGISKEYLNAMATYVTGILIKDQRIRSTGTMLPLKHYKEKMQSALEILGDFNRPIARVICLMIRFNLNDFRKPVKPSGVGPLDDAMEFFSNVADCNLAEFPGKSGMTNSGCELPACPVDRDSRMILSLFREKQTHNFIDLDLPDLAESIPFKNFSEYDRTKMQVLSVFGKLGSIVQSQQDQYLKELAYDPVFDTWAVSRLEGRE